MKQNLDEQHLSKTKCIILNAFTDIRLYKNLFMRISSSFNYKQFNISAMRLAASTDSTACYLTNKNAPTIYHVVIDARFPDLYI